MLHPSGRIWLAGAWGPNEIAVGRNGEATVAVMGDCSLTPSEVDRRTKAVRTVADVESMLADAAGTFLVLACVRGRFYGRGPLSGSDRIFTAIHKGHTLIADRARTLACLTEAPIDTRQVSARKVSLAAAILCRMSGTWPQWCAGVRATAPFASHAWIEADGRPVGESTSIAAYRTMISV